MIELIFSFDGVISLGPFNYDIPKEEFYIEWIDKDYYEQPPRTDQHPIEEYSMFGLAAAFIFNCHITSSYYYCEKVKEPTFAGKTFTQEEFKDFQYQYEDVQLGYGIELCRENHDENSFSYINCLMLKENDD